MLSGRALASWPCICYEPATQSCLSILPKVKYVHNAIGQIIYTSLTLQVVMVGSSSDVVPGSLTGISHIRLHTAEPMPAQLIDIR